MDEYDDVCVLVPTYEEASTIGDVVRRFREQGFERVLVVDGGSTDGTRELAREAGARVIEQSGSGKGQAVREALGYVEAPYVLMVDGDATYRPEDADRMVAPLLAGEAEHVIGNRFADMQPGAMSRFNKVGNGVINRAFRWIHGEDFRDILSGYRAFTRRSVEGFLLTAEGFGIETELAVECVKHGVETTVVPVTYEPRPDDSETNLSPVRDGATIILTLYQMAKTNNPLFYFGSVGVASTLVGLVLAAYVGVEWVTRGISHEVIAVVAGVAVLFGVQVALFGVLADLIVDVNREQTRQFERVARQVTRERGGGEGDPVADGSVADPPAGDEEE
ncbi:S-layer glycoprotein N-glycosyltransferase AglJ [Salinirussus salinus]|jgi:dolichol-phosphate mannosyltransferase|uniref:S-layer glycoprotein N-glycosyltransferase AglJ n=1 Tax=Salinirussus salinus TaxID=1198300 RepID=UPI0013594F2E|nr:S-layer glycoprotein N-glycosyltransferase AglJ [Salinirussus salinus]